MLYNNNNNNNNISRLFRFWYERVYFFLPSVLGDTRKETQFIKAYAHHTMLAPPTPMHSASCSVEDLNSFLLIETQTDLISTDPKNSTATLNGRTSTELFSKSSNSLDHLFRVWRQPSTQFTPTARPATFTVWSLLWLMMIVISFPRGHVSALFAYFTWTRDNE